MKKIIAICATGIVLASCGTRTVVVEKEPTETNPPVVETTPRSDSENFLNGLTSTHPSEVAYLGKSRILEMGRLTCQAIDEGSTLADFVDLANSLNVDAGFIGALIRESVTNFCPDNQWFIDSALNSGV